MISGVFRGIIHIVENVIKTVLRMGKTAGVVLAGITAYSVKTGMSFDQMMSKVQAFSKINSKTSEEFKMLRQAAFEMGRTTEHTAVQSAAALVELAKGGLTARQQVEALTGVLNLATIGSVETTEAAGTMLGIMKAMGLEASELALVADKMAVAITSTKATVESLSEALSYSSNVAKLYNVPLSEVLTTLGLLSDASIEGSMSGTSYRRIMIMLGKDAAATAEEMEKLRQSTSEDDRGFLDDLEKASGILKKKFGVELLKANGDMESMGKIIGQMNKGMKEMGSVAKNTQLEQVFQVRGITSMGALLAQGEAAFKDLFHEIDTGLGTSDRMRATMMDNLAGDVTKFRSAMSAVGISISDTLKDRLRAATKRMTSWLNDNEAQIAATFDRVYDFIEKWGRKVAVAMKNVAVLIADDWRGAWDLLEDIVLESLKAMAELTKIWGKKIIAGLGEGVWDWLGDKALGPTAAAGRKASRSVKDTTGYGLKNWLKDKVLNQFIGPALGPVATSGLSAYLSPPGETKKPFGAEATLESKDVLSKYRQNIMDHPKVLEYLRAIKGYTGKMADQEPIGAITDGWGGAF